MKANPRRQNTSPLGFVKLSKSLDMLIGMARHSGTCRKKGVNEVYRFVEADCDYPVGKLIGVR